MMPTMRFAAQNGLINNPEPNDRHFADDSSYYLLCSLENVDEDGRLEKQGGYVHQSGRSSRNAELLRAWIRRRSSGNLHRRARQRWICPYMAELLEHRENTKAIQAGAAMGDLQRPDGAMLWKAAGDCR